MDTLTITLAVLAGLFAIALIVALLTRPTVVTVSDDAPQNPKNGVLKLQNELKPYTYVKDGKVCMDVVKRK